jgi:ATP-dependent RNA helicase RhlB
LQVSGSISERPSAPESHLTGLHFADMPLSPAILQGLADAGFSRCTPIQMNTLPLALQGRDVAGQAQTGTGKTAAYLIALFNRLESTEPAPPGQSEPRALVLAPTRELAVQIHSDACVLGAHLPLTLGLAFGGTDYDKQRRALAAGVDVLIGTPGRIIDYYKQGVYNFKRVAVLVLDEADRMFDLGFIRDIRYVLRRLPRREERQNLLFSATLSYRVLELAYEHMNEPELIRIEPDKMTVDSVRQSIYFPSNEEKPALLIAMLHRMDARRTMVFVNTRREAERLRDQLRRHDIQAEALSGDVPQRKRLKMLKDFQLGELSVLIATDVASRGLHVPDVSHVFNYDLPQDAEDYVHRIGRTARAGASGDAISFGCEAYVTSLPDIEAYIGRRIPVEAFDASELPKLVPGGRDGGGPRKRSSARSKPGSGSGSRSGSRSRPSESGSRRAPKAARGENGREGTERQGGATDPASPPAESGDGAPRKKRRRRRRRSTSSDSS